MTIRRSLSKLYRATQALLFRPSVRLTAGRSLVIILSALAPLCAAEGNYVARYDLYAGYAYLESPAINLATRGFQLQFGYNLKPWLAAGFDYSNSNGTLAIIPRYLPTDFQQQVNALLQFLPRGYSPAVTTDVNTQTFAIGPAIVIRKVRRLGFIIHPSIGAVRELATPYPTDFFTQTLTKSLVSGKHKLDWQGFYGIGGGIDFHVTKHIALRMHTDLVWDHLFNDILRDGRWTVRASIGPSFHFGKDIRSLKKETR